MTGRHTHGPPHPCCDRSYRHYKRWGSLRFAEFPDKGAHCKGCSGGRLILLSVRKLEVRS